MYRYQSNNKPHPPGNDVIGSKRKMTPSFPPISYVAMPTLGNKELRSLEI